MSQDEAERLFSEIFGRAIQKWTAVSSFRKMGQLGLREAIDRAEKQHADMIRLMLTDPEYAPMFKVSQAELAKKRFFDAMPAQMALKDAATFRSALDAASLIFTHSFVDSAALDYCRVCFLTQPMDFLARVGNRKVSLAEVGELGFEKLVQSKAEDFLKQLERESLLTKVDTLFALCRPPEKFQPMDGYNFDRGRLEQLDALRHDYIHGAGPGFSLPNGEDDLTFLDKTVFFFMSLVNHRYNVKVDPNVAMLAQQPGAAKNE